MTVWTESFTAEVVRRYLAGDGPTEIARCFDLTRNQVLAKLQRLGHVRATPTRPERDAKPKAPERSAYGKRVNKGTRAEKLVACLNSGPKWVHEIVSMTSLTSASAAQSAAALMKRGVIVRLNPGARVAQYALRPDGAPVQPPAFRGEVAAAAEEAYIAARKGGKTPNEVALSLSLSVSSAIVFEQAYRYQTTAGSTRDNTVPKFAHDDRHLKVVWRASGFPAWSERRGPGPRAAVCLPIIWPSATIDEARG